MTVQNNSRGKGGSPGRRVASATVKILTCRVCTENVVSPVYALGCEAAVCRLRKKHSHDD
jgi:hypothetical protein